MLFHFKLRPLDEVAPWGDDKPNLHWFGLSDGWYWWQVGSQELFRYSQPVIDQLAEKYPDYHSELPYEDYQLGRPWEDLLGFLSEILDPIPDDLVDRIQDKEEWQNLLNKAQDWMEAHEDDLDWTTWDLYDLALGWWLGRKWDAGYLRCPPKVWMWTPGNTFYLRWDNRNALYKDIPAWSATFGEITMPVTEFMEEVGSFHERLMAAMAERVDAVRSGALRPEIAMDRDGLMRDHEERSGRLARILAMPQEKQNWDEVRKAISTIERMCYNNGVEGP